MSAPVSHRFQPRGRVAVVGIGGANPFGTAETSYLIRTGRFNEALRKLARLMGCAPDAGYVDRRIGLRVVDPKDTEQTFDPQKYRYLHEMGDGTWREREMRLNVSHAGILPSGWNLAQEGGFAGPVFDGMARAHLMGFRAAAEAVLSTGLPWEAIASAIPREQRMVSAGNGLGPGKALERGLSSARLGIRMDKRVDNINQYIPDALAFWMAKLFGASYSATRVNACNTGIAALEAAFDKIAARRFLFAAVVTGESTVNGPTFVGFDTKMALATDASASMLSDHSSMVSRPGMIDRSGFLIGEGLGALLLMDMELAVILGLKIYAELRSVGIATGPVESLDEAAPTSGGALAFERAIRYAAERDGVSPEEVAAEIDFINAHGTSTPAGDDNGVDCADRVLEKYGRDPRDPVAVVYAKGGPRDLSSPGARRVGGLGIGHLLGGAGTSAAVETAKILDEGIVPAAVGHLNGVDPAILGARHLFFPTRATWMPVRNGTANAQGFGDSNGDALFRKVTAEDYELPGDFEARQQAADAWIRAQREAVEAGRVTPASFLPPLKIG